MASSVGRIRTIKPEFFGSPDTVAAHPIVRLAYIGLWCFADDHGRGEYDEDVLKGFLFPRQNIAALSDGAFASIGDVLAGVVDAYGVVLYTVHGRSYFDVPSFGRHQRAYRGRESKRERVKLAGNAVTPPAARDLLTVVAESLGVAA